MRTAPCILAFCLATSPVYAEVYKTIDQDGNVVYTDIPQPGSAPVTLPQPSTYAPPGASSTSSTPTPPPSAQESIDSSGPLVVYKSITLMAPQNEAVFTPEAAGSIAASVSVEPGLGPSDKIEFVLDGATVGGASNGTQTTLSGLTRGTHKILARIVNANGQVLKKSTPVVFYVQQHIIKRAK
jgi:hypothetical protein